MYVQPLNVLPKVNILKWSSDEMNTISFRIGFLVLQRNGPWQGNDIGHSHKRGNEM